MELRSCQTASSLIEILITMSLIAIVLLVINTTYTAHIKLITLAKNNLSLAAQLEEIKADAEALSTQ